METEREALGARLEIGPMTNMQKITLASSRDIPFHNLVLSQSNVRRVKAGISVDEAKEYFNQWQEEQNRATAATFQAGEV